MMIPLQQTILLPQAKSTMFSWARRSAALFTVVVDSFMEVISNRALSGSGHRGLER